MKKIINAIIDHLPENSIADFILGGLWEISKTCYFTQDQAKSLVQAAAIAAFPDHGHGKTRKPVGLINVTVGLGVKAMDPTEAADFYKKAAENHPWEATWAMAYVSQVFAEAYYQAGISASYEKWSKEEDWPEEYEMGYFSDGLLKNNPGGDHILKALAEYLGHAKIPDYDSDGRPSEADLLAAAKDVDHAAQVAWDEGMGPSAVALSGLLQKYLA